MFEIELKAHVDNYESTKNNIDAFANFLGKKQKSDTYWQCYSKNILNPVRVRIREEVSENSNGEKTSCLMVTYKKKELRKTTDFDKPIGFEVNEEHEFVISDRSAFETILVDTGFEIDLRKEKCVLQWIFDDVLLELCSITTLGDFLELEIIAESQDKKTVEHALQKLQHLLIKCGIPLDKIENRYYSELLKESNNT